MLITYTDFEKVEVRSGTITQVEPFPQARKSAYKITVDFGPEIGIKKTSAQVTVRYVPEELIGKKIAGVVNFPPKNIAGFMSEFLLLGFPDAQGAICLILLDARIPNGQKMM